MVVSRRCLSILVRATVTNLCFNHRLDNEGLVQFTCYSIFLVMTINFFEFRYSPPHVKRKRKIEDIGCQFSKHLSVSELYTDLISN